MKETVDATIIGAGVVGLAIAEAMAAKNRQIVVLEKNSSFGQETSSRNSEVIHAGIYYPKEFLKSRLCLQGNRLLYAWCENHQVPHQRIGKLIVATNEEECADLEQIKITAEDNGVDKLEHLGRAQLKSKEPDVNAMGALFSHGTGIIDAHRMMQTLLMSAKSKDAIIICRSKVTAIHFDGSIWHLEINDGEYCINTKIVVNSAGLHADRIAALAGIDIDAAGYRLKPCKGNYFTATPAPKINHLIYPVPVKNNVGLGIHATLDLSGRVRFGPDSRYLSDNQPFDYTVDEALKPAFHESIHKFLPCVSIDALNPDMSGIRPKIQGPGEPVADFVIREEGDRGLAGFINLIGIESPGLTACLAIGEYIRGKNLL
ncbi:MAG: NAD(P)/FAD-dependent oxidoreductase [Smithellaceae bacterium]